MYKGGFRLQVFLEGATLGRLLTVLIVGAPWAERVVNPQPRQNYPYLMRETCTLAPMRNRKTLDGFTFSVLLDEDSAGRLELTKA